MIPEIEAREILSVYEGSNNQLLEWKRKFVEVKNFKLNQRITVPFVNGCGTCQYCLQGDAQVCPTQTQPGFTHFGSFAQYVEIQNADFNLIALPDEIDFNTAAALGCRFATAFRGLTARAKLEPNQIVAVFGCGGERDRGKRMLMGRAASRHADAIILTSDNPRGEDPEAIIAEIASGIERTHERIVDRREAIARAIGSASASDVVLLAGKGHERSQEIGGRHIPFSDALEARQALEGWAG